MKALWLRFLDWFSQRFGIARTPVPREPLSYRPIGVVRNGVKQPRPDGWDQVRSTIVVREDLVDSLNGIEGYSHLIVVFGLDKVPESEQRLQIESPRAGVPELGVLATPILLVTAASPTLFAMVVERWGWAAAEIALIVMSAASWIAIEAMARWYEGRRR